MMSRVLIVDDEADTRFLLARALRAEFDVATAADGAEALLKAESLRPDLVMLDLVMPGMSGWRVLQALRRGHATRTSAVVVLTGDATSRTDARMLGADDLLAKPISLDDLRTTVRSVIQRRRAALWANPLTLLPGSPALEEEVRARTPGPIALLHIDLDGFKAYNDRNGFSEGDQAIRRTASILTQAVDRTAPEAFPVHIGGDDFAVLCRPDEAELLARSICRDFDGRGADGLTLSVAGVRCSAGTDLARLAAAAAPLKARLKSDPDRRHSRCLVEDAGCCPAGQRAACR